MRSNVLVLIAATFAFASAGTVSASAAVHQHLNTGHQPASAATTARKVATGGMTLASYAVEVGKQEVRTTH